MEKSRLGFYLMLAKGKGRLSPVESNSDEDCALNDAEVGIKALITERTDRFVWNASPGHWTIGI